MSTGSVAKNRASINVSLRLPSALTASELTTTVDAIAPPLDLTLTNPTRAGFAYPSDALAEALGRAARVPYEPNPLGALEARELLARLTGDDPGRLMLTASTSEAYAIAIKTFVSPGEAVAVPRPSYPLVPHLAELEGVRSIPWTMDDGALGVREALGAGARMVVVVSPNNPTGAVLPRSDLYAIAEECAAAAVPLVIDTVFAAYGLENAVPPVPHDLPGTVLVLDGLSKRAGLPHLKVAWTAVRSADDSIMRALTWVNDAYLSCGIAQHVLPEILSCGELVAAQIRERVRLNMNVLVSAFADVPVATVPTVDAGWSALVRVPRIVDEDTWVVACARAGVRVQPGYFYDFDTGAHLVMSLLPPSDIFRDGVHRVADCVRATTASFL